ncbi:MAG: hypothetical protein ABW173_02600 [Sphingomonas sp.]
MSSLSRALLLLAAASLPLAIPAYAAAPEAPAMPAAAPGHYSVQETTLGTLLDDPAAKAVLDKNIPGLSANPQIDMGRSLTLSAIQGFSPDQVTDKALTAIQTDLNALPAKQ